MKYIIYFIVYNFEKSLWTEACYKKLLIGNLKFQKIIFDAKYACVENIHFKYSASNQQFGIMI